MPIATDVLPWIEQHPGLAAWIQALGAIATIAATAVIALGSSRAERKRRKEEWGDLVHTLEESVSEAMAAYAPLREPIAAENFEAARKLAVADDGSSLHTLSRLTTLPPPAWPSPMLLSRAHWLTISIDRVRKMLGQPPWDAEAMRLVARRVEERFEEYEATLRRVKARL